MRKSAPLIATVALTGALLLALSPLGAQVAGSDHESHLKAYDRHKAMASSSPYKNLSWSFVGPTNISGRIADVAVADRGASRRLYAGSCCGGVWTSDDLGQTWLWASLALYVLIGACWLPVVYLQIKMRNLAEAAVAAGEAKLGEAYRRLSRIWFWLGWPAFLSMLVIFWLMIAKPA